VAVQYGVLKWASHSKKIILDKPKEGSRHKRVGLDKATDHLITLWWCNTSVEFLGGHIIRHYYFKSEMHPICMIPDHVSITTEKFSF